MRDLKEAEVRRAEIMEVAMNLFTVKGYLNTTTQDIIDEVNISRGLLYYHFKNKEDILYCLVEKYSEPLLRQLKHIAYAEDKDALQKLRLFIKATMIEERLIKDRDVKLQEIINMDENRYLMDRMSHKVCEGAIKCFEHILEQGNSEGVFNVAYPKGTATFLITGYIFSSSDLKVVCQSTEVLQQYFDSYLGILEKVLATQAIVI